MRSVLPAPASVASRPTTPSPSGSLTASFARPPPVSGSPPKPSASTAAGSSTGHSRRAPLAAATPTARNKAPLARTW